MTNDDLNRLENHLRYGYPYPRERNITDDLLEILCDAQITQDMREQVAELTDKVDEQTIQIEVLVDRNKELEKEIDGLKNPYE